jgi:RNA-directed DNA polymerase
MEFNFEPVSSVPYKAKQETETYDPAKWDWVEAQVWTERMLAALVNGVKGGKWYSLIDKVYNRQTLKAAWKRVAANRGAAGVDRVSIERFRFKAQYYLEELERDLRKGLYRPLPVRRVYIPKGNQKTRPLGIPTVKDRIVQTALKIVLEPIFENEFLNCSYGFRPKRGCKDALREVDRLLKEGYTWVVDADIKSYFDTIPHDLLMNCVRAKVSDGKILQLVELFLNQEIMEDMKCWSPVEGTPQGAVLSPLLANVYLHQIDLKLLQCGRRIIRYADDFVVLCQSREEAQAALADILDWMEEVRLQVSPEKTHVDNSLSEGHGFQFLGYRFEAGCRYVRTKSLKKFKDSIRLRTRRTRGDSIEQIIADVNPSIKGWFEYFKHAHHHTFSTLDGLIRRRLRAILSKQRKCPGSGRTHADHRRWPNTFFAERGLFTMHQAYVLACRSR